MALLFIRHGQTVFNADRIVQFPDTPLSPVGLRQAEQLGRCLGQRQITAVLSSDYARARRTAEEVAKHCAADLHEVTELRERNFGEIRGQKYADLQDEDIFAADYIPPGGEAWPIFDRRVDLAWSKILSMAAQCSHHLAVVTHGLVLKSLFQRVVHLPQHVNGIDEVVANASITEVESTPPWRVRSFAATDHLDPLENSTTPA